MTSRSTHRGTKPTHPAKQERSRQTLRRLLDATSTLLQNKSFDDISITEIVESADSSVGAFYARFKDKEGILEQLGQIARDETISEDRGEVALMHGLFLMMQGWDT